VVAAGTGGGVEMTKEWTERLSFFVAGMLVGFLALLWACPG